ncbi:MAG: 8-oxo-dGTP diphosphatase MutT [Proteobacteria bacterium]|jgi:8-oxo-dGTP diphosphatase|nr:8-oxo-dGTP diphosphatase MutT [Pseudomonadota bacterium]MDA1136335.1 8-oxo-dGTP diphosphatase MutT [Pseudomonadota bacterium]|tara:strand:- start:443 stop:865 length:423 start_codon:yes stop_codon:yes gene_type:complete
MQITDPKKLIIVAAIALIDADDQVLIAKRPKKKHLSGLWEFPGGKVEKNESPENALVREIKEELNININNKCIAPLTFSEFKYEEFNLLLLLYICRRWDGTPMSMENNSIRWVKANKLREYNMPPADDSLIYSLQDLLLN